jgi:hypothetical protein
MASAAGSYREDVEQARRRFGEFRQAHAARSRLPKELWATAAKLARRDGITATARVLGVDRRVFKSGRIDWSLAVPQSHRNLRAGIRCDHRRGAEYGVVELHGTAGARRASDVRFTATCSSAARGAGAQRPHRLRREEGFFTARASPRAPGI